MADAHADADAALDGLEPVSLVALDGDEALVVARALAGDDVDEPAAEASLGVSVRGVGAFVERAVADDRAAGGAAAAPSTWEKQVARTIDTLFCQPLLLQHRINQGKGQKPAKVAAR